MQSPPLLNYASAPTPEPIEVHVDPVEMHLALPPVSNRLFALMLVPYVVGPLVLVGGLAWMAHAARDGADVVWMIAVGYCLTGTFFVVRLARCRSVERVVGATPLHIYYSDARTAGQPATLLRRDLVDVRVRRGPLRPWIWELVAVPRRRILVVSSNVPLEPVVLLFGLDRATLERIAADLRSVCTPPATKPTPSPP